MLLAFDIGTSSLRTALFDRRARRREAGTAQQDYPLRSDVDGRAELDPGQLLRAARACLRATLQRHEEAGGGGIDAVGASCFWHSLLGVDERGRALTPVYTWADSRCAEDATRLRRRFDERAVHRRTGCMLRPSFWPAKLCWLRRTDPRLFAAVRYWCSPVEWLYWRLAGVRACATGMATGTGLFDPSRLDWDDELLAACGVRREQLLPIDDAAQRPAAAARRRLGALADADWYAGIGDGAASNLGSGATTAGCAAINVGTSAAVRVMQRGKTARAPFGLFAYRADRRRYLLGGAVSNAGNLRAWCLRELRIDDDSASIERVLAKRPRAEHGLTVLPFWSAERAPRWRDDMRGCIHGLHQASTALDILQACTEASYQQLAGIVDAIAGRGRLRIVASGGIGRSQQGLQRLANVLGRPIIACKEAEASLRGAAVDVLERRGLRVAAPGGRRVAPRAAVARHYAEQRRAQSALEELLYPVEPRHRGGKD